MTIVGISKASTDLPGLLSNRTAVGEKALGLSRSVLVIWHSFGSTGQRRVSHSGAPNLFHRLTGECGAYLSMYRRLLADIQSDHVL